LVCLLFFAYGFTPDISILAIPIVIAPIFLLTLGMGLILSLLNGIVRDIGNILGVLMTFFMFLTPVLYEKPASGILAHVTNFNPLYYLVSAPRELVLMGKISEWEGFLLASITALFIFVVCMIVFHLTETRVSERI
jgi:lipopolysaccharide transport system permease protein